jgi:hypothetical protein
MSTTTLIKIAVGGAMATCLFGCALIGGYPTGSLYTGTQVPHRMNREHVQGPAHSGDKTGEACATGILYAVAFGDASLDAAKKAGSITEVHSVEFHGTNILGVYSQGCTQVHGK